MNRAGEVRTLERDRGLPEALTPLTGEDSPAGGKTSGGREGTVGPGTHLRAPRPEGITAEESILPALSPAERHKEGGVAA